MLAFFVLTWLASSFGASETSLAAGRQAIRRHRSFNLGGQADTSKQSVTIGKSYTIGQSDIVGQSNSIVHSDTVGQSGTMSQTMAQLAQLLGDEDVKMRKNAQYSRITDSLAPFSQSLAEALADTSKAHFLGMQVPDFKVPRVHGQKSVPYHAFYDETSETYRGGHFLSYLSRGPLSKDKYDSVPCGCDEKTGDPDPQVVPQDVWDGNVIASYLERQKHHQSSNLVPATASDSTSAGSKDLVVLLNFVQAGYWGHMMDNGLPRVAIAAKAAKQAGYNLHVLIPPEKVVYGWQSLGQVKDMVEKVFGGRLVVPGESEDQLPEHCLDEEGASSEGHGVCRFFFTCGLPSFHQVVRQEFYHMAQEALDRHQSLLETGARRASAPPRPGLFLARGADAHNLKGDAFSPELAKQLQATGSWDLATDLSSWNLMELGAFVRAHKHLLSVEGSGGYHVIWMVGGQRSEGAVKQASLLEQGSTPPTWIELQPTARVDSCRWLWAHTVGLDYKIVLYDKGETNMAAFLRAGAEVIPPSLTPERV